MRLLYRDTSSCELARKLDQDPVRPATGSRRGRSEDLGSLKVGFRRMYLASQRGWSRYSLGRGYTSPSFSANWCAVRRRDPRCIPPYYRASSLTGGTSLPAS